MNNATLSACVPKTHCLCCISLLFSLNKHVFFTLVLLFMLFFPDFAWSTIVHVLSFMDPSKISSCLLTTSCCVFFLFIVFFFHFFPNQICIVTKAFFFSIYFQKSCTECLQILICFFLLVLLFFLYHLFLILMMIASLELLNVLFCLSTSIVQNNNKEIKTSYFFLGL